MTEITYSNEDYIELANALYRLQSSSLDFAKVFFKDYQEKYVLKLVEQLALYDSSHPEYANIIRKLEAISLFKAYLNEIAEQGQSAKDEIAYLNRTLDIEERYV